MEINNNLSQKYSKGIIIIHWITTILILILFPLGKYMSDLPVKEKLSLIQVHAILGILVLVLTLVRTYLFFKSPRPPKLNTGSKINDSIAIWIHNVFYFLLFAVTLTGLITVLIGGYRNAITTNNPELIKPHEEIYTMEGHEFFALLIIVLLVLHVAGVIKHYILTKENTIKRIS